MSDPTVTSYLTQLLCSHGGRLRRDQLSGYLELPPEQIEQILLDEPQKFSLVGDLVLARNPVRICTKYLKDETEEECDKLHMCRYYLQGKCKRKHCKFSHDITTDHNRSILKNKEICRLNVEELKVLLLQNDSQILPEICWKYQRDSCDLGQDCVRLHICDFFTRGECNRRFCKRSHNLLDAAANRCQMPEVSLKNFQILSELKHNERLQSLNKVEKKDVENGNPAVQRSRGRPTKKGDYQDFLRNKSRGRQEGAGCDVWERSRSRPTSENGESPIWFGDNDDEWNEFLKTQQDIIKKKWFNSSPSQSDDRGASFLHTPTRTYPIFQPSMSSGMQHPTPTVTTIPPASPQVSFFQQGIPVGLFTPSSSPSAPQPAITPAGSVNAPPKPSNFPTQGPSVMDSKKPVSPSLVKPPNVTPVPPTRPSKIDDSPIEGPSVRPEKPMMAPITKSSIFQSVDTTKPWSSPETHPSLVNSPMKGSFAPLEKPVTTSTVNQNNPHFGVTTIRTETSATKSASISPSISYPKSVDSYIKVPSIPQEKLVTASNGNPSITQAAVTIKSVTTPTAGPSTAPPPSYPRLVNSPTEGLPVLHVKPVQSSVQYQPVPDDKQILRAGVPEDLVTAEPTFSDPQMSPKRVDPNKVPEICLSKLWKYCSLGKDCPDMHYYLPYRWQIHKGTDWEDVKNMEEVEKSYCDPKVDRVPLIDFLTMRSGGHRARRLSTVSSVVKPSEYVLTTEWLWYWRDEYGSWIQYGQSNKKDMSSNILSSDLENVYLPDPVAVIPFMAGNQIYEIKFREMKQKNIIYKTEKDVRRRPKFLSFDDVKLLRGSTRSAAAKSPLRSGTSPMNTDVYPKIWDPEAMPEVGCKKVLVSDTSIEFVEIVSSFSKTVRRHEVKKIWRLQNPSLWQVFQWQKEQMKKVNRGRDVKEIRLFHGTERTHIDAICNQNFDWRICGTHGTVYGQGSYFARDASYSHNYSTPTPSGTRAMFVARVLVGDYVTGNPQMKLPPLRPGSSSQYYDSCVDNTTDPSIFVVFEKQQIYPEYLLEYEEEQKKSCIVG
ncbi:zinc finger CCCH-type antiviral protein 1-like isoform X1 [Ranitomeya variabilis]|uniref:zinc finger CCCH-type antiviral protein 1-like isoform X1 n=1 Tax=Ranitomeya variabilis TaxID=490064 RepID=UPI004056C7DA